MAGAKQKFEVIRKMAYTKDGEKAIGKPGEIVSGLLSKERDLFLEVGAIKLIGRAEADGSSD